jgi:hypothetical protein
MSPGSFIRRSMQLNGIVALRLGFNLMPVSVAEAPKRLEGLPRLARPDAVESLQLGCTD